MAFLLTKSTSARASVRSQAVPDNVQSARDWISAWKKRSTGRNAAWFPGTTAPKHLDGTLAGDFGFDPLCLGDEPEKLKWYVQAELMNGRTAMLAVAGILGPELATSAGVPWPGSGVAWYDAGKYEYFAPASTLFAVQMLLFAFVEARRWQDFQKPGSADQDPIFSNNKVIGKGVGYPGLDPMGMAKGADFEERKLKEIKNGRLAMVAFLGFVVQHQTTGTTPLANLSTHLADPWNTTVLSLEHTRL